MTTDIAPSTMGLFTRNWGLILLRGIVAILFGIFALNRPHLTLAMLVLWFGIYVLIDGAFSLFGALAGWGHREDRWLLLLEGLVGIGVGFVTLQAPGITAVALMFFIAIWALASGVLRIIAAIRLRRQISGEFWMILSGIAAIVFAFLVMERPGAGALAMIWAIGWFAIFMGAMLVMLSFRLRSLTRPGYRIDAATPRPRRAA